MNDKCPICDTGILTEMVDTNEVSYKNMIKLIELHYSLCNNCGSELTNHEQSVLNKELMKKFKESVDNETNNYN